MAEVKPRRRYRSQRRGQQAAATRLAIREAARQLFIERGYAATTIEAIAREARVAAVTVYSTFGSKKAVLMNVIDVSLVGDEAPIPLLEREGPREVAAESDQRRQVAMFAAQIAEVMERVSPLFEVLRNAAPADPEIEGLLATLLRGRLAGMRRLVEAVARNGPLREAPSVEAAAETAWTLSSPEVHRLLTVRLGWSKARYARWLEDTVAAALLPPQA